MLRLSLLISMTTALLIQSLLLILSQLLLLFICLHFAPLNETPDYAPLSPLPDVSGDRMREPIEYLARPIESTKRSGRKRPFDFWQWEGYGTYLEFLAALIVVLGLLQMVFGRWMWLVPIDLLEMSLTIVYKVYRCVCSAGRNQDPELKQL